MITEVFEFFRCGGSDVVSRDACSFAAALKHTGGTFDFFS